MRIIQDHLEVHRQMVQICEINSKELLLRLIIKRLGM